MQAHLHFPISYPVLPDSEDEPHSFFWKKEESLHRVAPKTSKVLPALGAAILQSAFGALQAVALFQNFFALYRRTISLRS